MKKTEPRYQCRHIFTAGHRCGSPALRNEEFCYYHHNTRKPAPKNRPALTAPAPLEFDLPIPEDRAAIQQTLALVMRRIATNQIDPRRAGLLLYGLSIAASVLPKPQKQAARSTSSRHDEPRYEQEQYVDEIIDHPEHGPLAPQSLMPSPEDLRPKSLASELLRALQTGKTVRELEDMDNNNHQEDVEDDDVAEHNNQTQSTIPTLQAIADPTSAPSPDLTNARQITRSTVYPTCYTRALSGQTTIPALGVKHAPSFLPLPHRKHHRSLRSRPIPHQLAIKARAISPTHPPGPRQYRPHR